VVLAREEAGRRCWLAFSACAGKSVSFALSQSWRLFTILNSISAEVFPQKDKLCYLVPTLPNFFFKLLLLFPQKDKLCFSDKRISHAAFLADFKETSRSEEMASTFLACLQGSIASEWWQLAFSSRACEGVSFAQSWRFFTILNSVISAKLFPQKDKLCYLVPILPQKDTLLLLFPQKDKQRSSQKRISHAAFLADFKETK
jgi:hypothetical protein